MSRSRRHRSAMYQAQQALHDVSHLIWGLPGEACPKCKSTHTEYYDPFFFAPIRTLLGKRRIQCRECGFIWRPSRTKQTIFSKFAP